MDFKKSQACYMKKTKVMPWLASAKRGWTGENGHWGNRYVETRRGMSLPSG